MNKETVFLYFVLATIPTIYSILKIIKRLDLNTFDLLSIFHYLYFIVAPANYAIEEPAFIQQIVNKPDAILYYIIFSFLLFIVNVYWGIFKSNSFNIINITKYIKYWDAKIILKHSYIYIFIIFGILSLLPVIQYGDLTENDTEANLQYYSNSSFFLNIYLTTLRNITPVLILFNFIYFRNCKIKRNKRIALISLLLFLVASILGVRQFLIFNISFLGLYVYSVSRESITFNKLAIVLFCTYLFFMIVFPLSMSLRLTKQEMVANSKDHSFLAVFNVFFNSINSSNPELLDKSKSINNRRSVGLYNSLETSYYSNYSGNGEFTYQMIENILPTPITNNPNIISDKCANGGDIAESVLMFFAADFKIMGALFSVFCFILFFETWAFFKKYIRYFLRDGKVEFLFICCVFNLCFLIENNIFIFFHSFFNVYSLVFVFFWSVFYITDIIFQNKIVVK